MTVTLRYWAGIKAAADTGEEAVPGATLAQALAAARERHGSRFADVLACCSFVVDGDPVGGRSPDDVRLSAGALVDCLPPFAGG